MVSKYGKPAKGIRVVLSFSSISSLGHVERQTDYKGQAVFDKEPGEGKIYVDGRTMYEGRISGGHGLFFEGSQNQFN